LIGGGGGGGRELRPGYFSCFWYKESFFISGFLEGWTAVVGDFLFDRNKEQRFLIFCLKW